MMRYAIVLALLATVSTVYGSPTGAPPGACPTLTPVGHGVVAQNAGADSVASPYTVTLSSVTVTQGMELTVSISAANVTYKGFLIAAQTSGDTPALSGMFKTAEADALWKNSPCPVPGSDSLMASATHNSNATKNMTELVWQAPADYVGDLCFKGAIVEEFSTWWTIEEMCFTVEAAATGGEPSPKDDENTSSSLVAGTVLLLLIAAGIKLL